MTNLSDSTAQTARAAGSGTAAVAVADSDPTTTGASNATSAPVRLPVSSKAKLRRDRRRSGLLHVLRIDHAALQREKQANGRRNRRKHRREIEVPPVLHR